MAAHRTTARLAPRSPASADRLQGRRVELSTQALRPEQLVLPLVELQMLPPQWPHADARPVHLSPSRAAASVASFHRAFHLPMQSRPSVEGVPSELLALRERLLDEEATEFAHASHHRDLAGMADALADVVYVAYGTAITLGLDLDALLDEVHRSNMSKLDAEGRPVLRDDGKVLKSPRYAPPNIERVIDTQLSLPF